jgi:hypothetical protein
MIEEEFFGRFNKQGGAPRWGEPLLVPGKLSTNTCAIVDTLPCGKNR